MTVMMAITMATIGRWMKNLDIALPACRGRWRDVRGCWRLERFGVHRKALAHLLSSFDHNAVSGLQTLLNDPGRSGSLTYFHRLDVNLVIARHDVDLIVALQLRDRALRNEQRALFGVEPHPDAGELARAKNVSRIRKQRFHPQRARGRVN